MVGVEGFDKLGLWGNGVGCGGRGAISTRGERGEGGSAQPLWFVVVEHSSRLNVARILSVLEANGKGEGTGRGTWVSRVTQRDSS